LLGGEYGREGEFDYGVNEKETSVKGMGSTFIDCIRLSQEFREIRLVYAISIDETETLDCMNGLAAD